MTRVGPKMQAAIEYVRAHPGATKLAVAEAIGPHGSRRYGYLAVDRAIAAGVIASVGPHQGRYRLYTEEPA